MSNLVVFLYATLDHDHGIITHGCTVSYSHTDVLEIEMTMHFFALSYFIGELRARHRGLLFEENENFTTLAMIECSQNREKCVLFNCGMLK
jgi:hypothetical protein